MTKEVLRIEGLHAWYGESHILHGVDVSVNEGEVVCLLGRNGAGRTTTMRAIMGLTGARKGSIKVKGQDDVAVTLRRTRLCQRLTATLAVTRGLRILELAVGATHL